MIKDTRSRRFVVEMKSFRIEVLFWQVNKCEFVKKKRKNSRTRWIKINK